MKKLLLATTASACLALTFSTAQAADLETGGAFKSLEGFYVSGSVGAVMEGETIQSIDGSGNPFDTGLNYGGAIGYDFGSIRVEGELSHLSGNHEHKYSAGDKPASTVTEATATSLMANAWYDVDTGTKFTPYLGGGIGMARVTSAQTVSTAYKTSGYSGTNTEFAYQVGVGVDYSITEEITAGLGYRYLASGDNDFHTVNVGMRYTF
jgi:opacity protein-like surface antigen